MEYDAEKALTRAPLCRHMADVVSEKARKFFVDYMEKQRIDQISLAAHVGISQSRLSKILGGHIRMTLDVFVAVCDGLGVDPCQVLSPPAVGHSLRVLTLFEGLSPSDRMVVERMIEGLLRSGHPPLQTRRDRAAG